MGTLSWSAGQSTRDHSSSLIRTELTHKPANMSDFWLQKMRTYFDRIDFDKDGAITRKDFEGMAERFSEKLDATKAADLKTTITNVWDKYLQGVGGGEAIQKEPFINAMKSLVKDPSNPSMKATVEGPLPLFFAAVDADGDGMISQEEYATFFQILGLAPTHQVKQHAIVFFCYHFHLFVRILLWLFLGIPQGRLLTYFLLVINNCYHVMIRF